MGNMNMLNNELPTIIVLHDFQSMKDSSNERQVKQRLTTSPDLIASHAGVFRGARFSSLPTNACSTENNIPFPLFYLRGN